MSVIDITLLAKLNAFFSSCDSAEYNGMNDVVNAPSAKNARNRLAKRNEEKNISAREVAPMTVAMNTSLIKPEILEMAVKKLNVKILLNILQFLPLLIARISIFYAIFLLHIYFNSSHALIMLLHPISNCSSDVA